MFPHITMQISCLLLAEPQKTHKIIKDNISKSAMYSWLISGVAQDIVHLLRTRLKDLQKKQPSNIP